ncbi:helix-turn-helix domain-containing protein [Kribbella caucasensis]|nr:helix-turn-helix transcriptional regulator [Kribbella sp. VKM Ac-2527]
MELGAELRERRKAAGRTIASVAVDAGLSVPYIANLENGRGNPTVSALERLTAALGARLQLSIVGDEQVVEPRSDLAALIAESPRAKSVVHRLAGNGRSRRAVEAQLLATLDSLATLLHSPPTDADLNRLLDLVLLATD